MVCVVVISVVAKFTTEQVCQSLLCGEDHVVVVNEIDGVLVLVVTRLSTHCEDDQSVLGGYGWVHAWKFGGGTAEDCIGAGSSSFKKDRAAILNNTESREEKLICIANE